jgi:DNA-directed RNA polymerase subunit M/transcription elongation factor TFIIS
MAIQLTCGKCGNSANILVDKETNKAHCSSCDAEFPTNQFIIATLIKDNQFRKTTKVGQETAFDLFCAKCSQRKFPNIIQVTVAGKLQDRLSCRGCGHDFAEVNPIIYNNYLNEVRRKIKEQKAEEKETLADKNKRITPVRK